MSAELTTLWARTLLHAARVSGVRDVIASPGSRSTPFVAAALAESGLAVRAVVDERSAAFFAVGQAKITGRPSLLIATSGSAATHYAPAVAEAAATHTPLLVLTADRPPELHDAGANQTMDQSWLFAERAVDLGAPDPRGLPALARRVAQAVLRARGGPVHLNAPVHKPLEPVAIDVALPEPPRLSAPERGVDAAAVRHLAERLRRAERPLILCGTVAPALPFDVALLGRVADRAGAVVVADATGPARFRAGTNIICDKADWLVMSPTWRRILMPDLVLLVGSAPLATAWESVLEEAELHVVAPQGHPNPTSTAASVSLGPLDAMLRALADALPEAASASSYRSEWQQGQDAVNRALETTPSRGFCEADAVRVAIERMPEDSVLFLGNSLAPREANLHARARERGPRVVAQRGLSGIDGLISGAAGAASASGAPTLLLLGDVSFLHDVGGLLTAKEVQTPLAIVVLNNGGGRIFEELPVATSGVDLRFWTTPHDLDLSHAAALYGHRFARPESPDALAAAVDDALGTPRATLIEARVTPLSWQKVLERL